MNGRAVGLAGLAWGALLLGRGDQLWCGLTGRVPSTVEHRVLTVLGLRHVGQGLLQTAAPRELPRLWLLTDLAHLASMVALAGADPARRRPALVSGAVSLASALGLAESARTWRRPAAVPQPLVTPRRARRPHG